MKPVDVAIGTPYGRRGSYWSCDRDPKGNGIHTGVDFPASTGTTVVAARPGTVVYANHGSAFGYHQIEIKCSDGTRDFYAHMRTRSIANGAQAKCGQKIGEVGSEGNVTGPHLHFERHNPATGGWSCSVVRDPQPSIDWQPEENPADMPLNNEDKDAIRQIVKDVMNDQRPSYVSAFLAGTVNDAKDTVKLALRKGLEHARGK